MKRFFLLFGLAVCYCCLMNAQTAVSLSRVEPAAGIATEIGTPNLVFNAVPSPNTACPEPATMTCGDKLIGEIYAYESSRLKQFTEGQSDQSIQLVFVAKKITAPGIYHVHVPANFLVFKSTGAYNEVIDFEYIIREPVKVQIDPAPGYVKALSNIITITFEGYTKVIDNLVKPDDYNMGSIRIGTPQENLLFAEGDGKTTIEGNKLILKIGDAPYTGAGTITLLIYSGSLTLVNELTGEQTKVGDLRFEWVHPLIPVPVISPAEGEVYEIGNISLTLEDGTFGQFMRLPSLYKNENGTIGTKVAYWGKEKQIVRGDKTVELVLGQTPVTAPGEYIIKIGRSSFSGVGPYNDTTYLTPEDPDDTEGDVNEGDFNDFPTPLAFTPMYADAADDIIEAWNNCDYLYYYTIVASPGEGETRLEKSQPTNSISKLTIYFPGAKEELYNNLENITEKIELRNRLWKVVSGYEFSVEVDDAADPKCAHITVTPAVDKKGTYTIVVPEGAFVCDDVDSRALMQEFKVDPTLTGVTVVDADALGENPDVYSIDGRLVVKAATPEQIEALPAGLYIASGVKFLKR